MKYLFTAFLYFLSPTAFALTQNETDEIIKTIDTRQHNSGDYKSSVFIEQKEKNKVTQAFEANVFRRDKDNKWMLLFVKPQTEAGKGYLRLEKNLFYYEPATGKWDRRTERVGIAGTNSRRSDFDESRLAEEYTSHFEGDEKLGKIDVYALKLEAKPNADVTSPILKIWVDKNTKNELKRQEFSTANKLLRTSYYPSWEKRFSPSKKADVYIPKKIIIKDEIETGNSTMIVIKDVFLDPLPENIFTKAWLESRSR